MSDIEYVTRPTTNFLNFRPPGKTTSREPIDDESVMIAFGSPGPNVFAAAASFKTADDQGDADEIERKFDVVRVKNPDDEEQYVDVEVMTEYQARNRISDKRTKIRFFGTEETDNIEILRRDQVRSGNAGG